MTSLEQAFINDMRLLESVFDIDQIISENLSLTDTEDYYAQSHIGYTWLHSFEGALHMALSDTDQINSKDYLAQVRQIAQDIERKNAYSILELGSGRGFNIHHLRRLLAKVVLIYGLDYSRLHVQQSYTRLQNNIVRADFHYIPIAKESFDYIYEIESICHATEIDKVLRDVYRILKSGGVFTIYDGFRVVPSEQLSEGCA